jgi:hypothetical protein
MNTKKRNRRRCSKLSRVGETATSVLRKIGLKQPGIHAEIWSRWSDIVGPELAKRTIPEGFWGKTLVLAVKSSSWLHELSFLKLRMLERLAEEVGTDVVTDIRMVVDTELPLRPSLVPPPPVSETDYSPLSEEVSLAVDSVQDDALRETIRRAAKSNLTRR